MTHSAPRARIARPPTTFAAPALGFWHRYGEQTVARLSLAPVVFGTATRPLTKEA
jgi:hypothetical protein